MLTIIESLRFQELVDLYLDEDSFAEFKTYLANHPEAGDVIHRFRRCAQNPLAPRWDGQEWWSARHLFHAAQGG